MTNVFLKTIEFITTTFKETLEMFKSVFYTNDKLNFLGWFMFVYLSIALLSAIINPLLNYFLGDK